MLNPSVNRKPVDRAIIFTVSVLALLVTAPLGAVRAGEESKPATAGLSQIVSAPAMISILKAVEVPVAEAPAKPAAAKRVASKPMPAQGLANESLSGTVSDGSGAVIPGVAVTVASRAVTQNSVTETEVQTVVANEVGLYSFAALTPGQYSLTAVLPGFTTSRTVVQIEQGQTLTHNITLFVGSVAQSVTVTAVGQPRPGEAPGVPRRVRVGGNVIAANLISQVRPFYPQSARDAGIEGVIHLQGLIGTDGTLIGLSPLGFGDPDLTNAALDAVRQWRYRPTLLNNAPVQVITTIDVEFKLAQ